MVRGARFPSRLSVPIESEGVLEILVDERRKAERRRKQQPHTGRGLVAHLRPFAAKRRPATDNFRYEPLAVWNAPINAVGRLTDLKRDVAGALPSAPDDNRPAGI